MKIELPYNFNFDKKYFNLLDSYKDRFQQIDCVYMPCFNNGSVINTRSDMMKYPKTMEEYHEHILEFQKRGINVTILMQRNTTIENIKEYYDNFNIRDFTINDHALAKEIKEKYNNIRLRLSITAKATVEEINNRELDPYDVIVLFFWYNRHLDVIKGLPKNHQYTVLANTRCMYNCPYTEKHWFGEVSFGLDCTKQRLVCNHILNFPNVAYIRPQDTGLFEGSVSTFKLEGREAESRMIFFEFERYLNEKEDKNPMYRFNDDIKSNYNI